MRLPGSAHTSQPWRIHELTSDFQLEDVWALPTPGGAEDFPRLVSLFASLDLSHGSSATVRALFAIRRRVGGLLGWDQPRSAAGSTRPSLRERLPDDLRGTAAEAGPQALPFVPLFMLENECAAEIVNRTVHGVLHLGWVPAEAGAWSGQMAVLVKRNGLLGSAYMAAITPFRHVIVYPRMMREIERRWRAQMNEPAPAPA